MGSHTAPDWPFDQEQKLRALWAKGLSAAQIARQIPGRSRNAVIGKAKRLNLEGRASPILPARPAGAPAPVRKPRAPKVKPQATTKASPVLGVPFPPAPPEQVEQKRAACAAKGKEVIAATAGVANDNAILLLDRRFGQCAWPVGDPVRPAEQMVCGAPIYEGLEGCSYCLNHAQRATVRDITQPRPKENLARAVRRWAA